jgi:hypothetical protein
MIFQHPYFSMFLIFIAWRIVWRVLFFPELRRLCVCAFGMVRDMDSLQRREMTLPEFIERVKSKLAEGKITCSK